MLPSELMLVARLRLERSSVFRSAEQRSAVCVFSLQDVRAAFAGGYMTFDVGTDQWKTFLGDRSLPGQVTTAPHSPNPSEPMRSRAQLAAAPPPPNHPITASNQRKEISN